MWDDVPMEPDDSEKRVAGLERQLADQKRVVDLAQLPLPANPARKQEVVAAARADLVRCDRNVDGNFLPSIFNHDDAGCRRILVALALLDTDVPVPGHGPLREGLIRDAVEQPLA